MIDIAKTKAGLEQRLHELTARKEKIDDDLRQPGDDDWAERAVEAANDEVLEEVGDITRDEIQHIRLALAQIDAGTYGTCTQCGDAIAEGRMAVLPHATKCVKCA